MRIVKGRDYYDGAVGVAGRDPEIVFVREPRLMSAGDLGIAGPESRDRPTLIDLIVAGVRYPCARVTSFDPHGDGRWTPRDAIVRDHASLERRVDPFRWWERQTIARWGRDVFEPRPVTAAERARLIEHRVTTAIFDAHAFDRYGLARFEWLINSDRLRDYHLAQVLDPFTCFQEIAMWVGGVLPHDPKPVVEITDDRVKAAKHGFDRSSFRKGKQPPRAKRQARSP